MAIKVSQSNCASRNAIFAPEPPAGLIAWIASPKRVTGALGQGSQGTEVRTAIGKISAGSLAAMSARRMGCQVWICFKTRWCSQGHEEAAFFAVDSAHKLA